MMQKKRFWDKEIIDDLTIKGALLAGLVLLVLIAFFIWLWSIRDTELFWVIIGFLALMD